MKIYTRTGDQGTTGLFGGGRVAKNDLRIAALGAIDELNAALGVAGTAELPKPVEIIVNRLQNQLFQLGSEVAISADLSANSGSNTAGLRDTIVLGAADVTELEQNIDSCEKGLPSLQAFILPGGTPAAAQLHFARAICRRAERDLVALSQQAPISDILLKYLNRTSDLLFVLARTANVAAGMAETEWKGLS
jgi:cob(I)alamin adenosyltransferase